MSGCCERCPAPASNDVLTPAGMMRLCKDCADAWWARFIGRVR
jgi:hypothetical protein